jgi:hypothetical protein
MNFKRTISFFRHFLILLFLGSVCSAFSKEKEDEKKDEQQVESKEDREKREKEEAEIKAKFGYSLDEIIDKLVIIDCKGKEGRSAGSGFIACMEGKTYLFTNQHVIMGTDRISFKTVDGKLLKPLGVELSKSRDIARLLLSDEIDGFDVSEKVLIGSPIAIFGNSEGGGVATELYGETKGIGADLVEVSAQFVAGNSGSPVLNPEQEVIGIASYVHIGSTTLMNKGTIFENKTRRFCYRLSKNDWKKVSWRSYNKKYGKTYLENERFKEDVFHFFEQWGKDLRTTLDLEPEACKELQSWVDAHNTLILKKARKRGSRASFRSKYAESLRRLSRLSTKRANQIRTFSEDPNLTEFLRKESEAQIYSLDSVKDACKYVESKIY